MQKRNLFVGTIVAAAIGFTGGYEGLKYTAYQDTTGRWSLCYGDTYNVKKGQTATLAECNTRLFNQLRNHNKPFESLPKQLPDNVHLAMLDYVYNVGATNATSSTLWKYLKAGEWENACNQLPRWRFVGGMDCAKSGSKCTGVYRRRLDEQKVCLGKLLNNDAVKLLQNNFTVSDGAEVR